MQLVGLQIGPNRLQECIGQGAMGEIYLAQDQCTPRQVAVKVVRTDTPGAMHLAESMFRMVPHVAYINTCQWMHNSELSVSYERVHRREAVHEKPRA